MRLPLFYFFLYSATGITIGYLPPWFRSLGLDGGRIALATSIQPLFLVFVPPIWGYLADRSRRPVALLRLACCGGAVAFSFLAGAQGFFAVAAILAVYSVFATANSSLADSVAVVEAKARGTEYARIRLWGSVGYVVSAWAFGAWLSAGGAEGDAVWAASLLMAAYAASTFLLRERRSDAEDAARRADPPGAPAPGAPGGVRRTPDLRAAAGLLRRPVLLVFFAAATLHWMALAPYHVFFAIHLQDLGAPASLAGTGFAVAVLAEVAVMWRFRDLASRLPPAVLLSLAFGSGALRWLVTGLAPSGAVVAAAQVLHGLGFGAFLAASIAWLEEHVPSHLRATGRALFSSLVFGVGGVAGNLLAGTLYDAGGGSLAFVAASLLELAPALLILTPVASRRAAADQPSL